MTEAVLEIPENRPSLKAWPHAGLWWWRHLRGHYPAEEAGIVGRFLNSSDVCLDIGAHAGSWTLPLCRLVPQGKVYAFEALPHYAHALKRLVRLCLLRNVEVRNQAVSESNGVLEIAWRTKAGKKLTGNTHVATKGESTEVDCVKVPAITLDGWLQAPDAPKGRIGFIKIDVEGAEMFVLRGAQQLLAQQRPVMFLEIVAASCAHYGYHPEDLFDQFAELRYRPYRVDFENGAPVLVLTDAETYPEKGDVLLVPHERDLPSGLKIRLLR